MAAMKWEEVQDEIRELANEILDLSKQIRTNSTDNDQLRLINIKLRSAQQRLEIVVEVQKENGY